VTARISLALALHNHQPVGNFGWVIAEVYEQAYLPMVEALERHPSVRVALHYSGPLLDWLRDQRPAFVARLRVLADRGQVEIMGGGYAEPILVSLPERDRIGQLRRMGDELEAMFGTRPTGAWLAERVWEPDLPTSLTAGGYAWTVLDDAHFRAAAIPEDRLWGPYVTEDQGRPITVFGTEQGLRYRIPWRTVEDVIDYLRAHATEDGSRVGMMGDDGEKFGAWPTTWAHCWGDGDWVERFFTALEANTDWLTTVTPSGWLAEHPPIGRVYVPTGSYAEMGEWALPPDEAAAFADAVHAAKAGHRPELRWLRGASWRNYQVKYREVNDLHKQMLRVSGKVEAMPVGPARDRALDHLYQGQSNDCYWHGLFGGVYISHMRLATHEHLIAAEDLADRDAGALDAAETLDLDLDGADEVRLATAGQVVTVDLEEGAGIGDWDVRAARHAVTAVLRRRPEAYHAKIADDDGAEVGEGAATASIHDGVRAKEAHLADHLVYDAYERRSGLVRLLPAGVTADDWANARTEDLADSVAGAFEVVMLGPGALVVRREAAVSGDGRVRVTKTIALGGGRLDPSLTLDVLVENVGETPVDARLGIEWTTTMLGGGGNPATWWEVAGQRGGHDGSGTAEAVTTLAQGNAFIGIAIETTASEPATAWWAPVETISNSEGGVERAYQGSGLLLSWPLALEPGARWSVSVENAVTVDRDRAEEA
jgi:alpha-amylase